MMMIPVQVIAFFLALLLLPADVQEFNIEIQGKQIQWKKTAPAAWHAVELPAVNRGDYTTEQTAVIVKIDTVTSRTDVSQYLKLPPGADAAKLQQIELTRDMFGTPIQIQRAPGKITLSQQKGLFFEKPAVITWKEKGK